MRSSFLGITCIVFFLSCGWSAGLVIARIRDPWPSSRLTEKADLVVIGQFVSTHDAKKSDKPPTGYDSLVGVESTFRVLATLKGKPKVNRIVLFHFRHKKPPERPKQNKQQSPVSFTVVQTPNMDDPCLVAFSLAKNNSSRYLLFLKARQDGRYECVSGQLDPDLSVARLAGPTDDK